MRGGMGNRGPMGKMGPMGRGGMGPRPGMGGPPRGSIIIKNHNLGKFKNHIVKAWLKTQLS
jgi:hypothetical protein